jgi:hypothetical protein
MQIVVEIRHLIRLWEGKKGTKIQAKHRIVYRIAPQRRQLAARAEEDEAAILGQEMYKAGVVGCL